MKKLSKRQLGAILSILIFILATSTSYLILNQFYKFGKAEITTEEGEIYPTPNNRLLAIGIGVSMGIVSLVVWEGGGSVQPDTISIMLHNGLEDLTVRDLEIVRTMMRKDKFTIPELQEHTTTSRQSIWRLVKKLKSEGLIDETNEKKLPKSGRGKPSRVYKYVGP